MKRIKFFFVVVILYIFNFSLFAQSTSSSKIAKDVVAEASKIENIADTISYVSAQIEKMEEPKEKRALYAFLASLQEMSNKFEDAKKSYVNAARISAPAADGMTRKSNEQFVLDAVRCALSIGDYKSAESYLNSSIRNTQNENIQASIKLYSTWSALCKATTESELAESLVMLKAYTSLDSMKIVRPALFLTLWHLTGENSWAESLKKKFPNSPEAGIVKGDVKMLPAPFWYFLPRGENVRPLIDDVQELADISSLENKSSATEKNASIPSSKKNESSSAKVDVTKKDENSEEKSGMRKLQLGLFREKANADKLVATLKEKGFTAYITTEKRSSGTVYYLVIIDETSKTLADTLRTAGFEFYPL